MGCFNTTRSTYEDKVNLFWESIPITKTKISSYVELILKAKKEESVEELYKKCKLFFLVNKEDSRSDNLISELWKRNHNNNSTNFFLIFLFLCKANAFDLENSLKQLFTYFDLTHRTITNDTQNLLVEESLITDILSLYVNTISLFSVDFIAPKDSKDKKDDKSSEVSHINNDFKSNLNECFNETYQAELISSIKKDFIVIRELNSNSISYINISEMLSKKIDKLGNESVRDSLVSKHNSKLEAARKEKEEKEKAEKEKKEKEEKEKKEKEEKEKKEKEEKEKQANKNEEEKKKDNNVDKNDNNDCIDITNLNKEN